MDTANTPTPAAAAPTEHSTNAPPSYDSAQLLGADGIAFITHQGQRYQLRQTKAGKLIPLSVIYIFSTLCGVKPIQIPVLNLITPPAIFIYPLTFILVDILNEFYGLRLARRTIIISFIANLTFVLGVWVTTLVPSIPQWEYSETYNGIVHSIMAVLVASSAAYLISENVNSYLLCKIKELTNSRYLFVRVITSTVVASAIDSVVFCTLAFYNVLSWDIIKTMILSQFLIKVVYALLGVGPIYATRSLFNRYINTEQAKGNEYAYPKAR